MLMLIEKFIPKGARGGYLHSGIPHLLAVITPESCCGTSTSQNAATCRPSGCGNFSSATVPVMVAQYKPAPGAKRKGNKGW